MWNIGAILGVGAAKFKRGRKPLIRDDHLFKCLIVESALLIWAFRLDQYKEKLLPTREEVRAKWVMRMNERLKIDRASTHQKFGKLATN